MNGQTMGQRIAERRKLLGLSQEGFGEKMGVSRQAISKWEADGAVPEIDKLIAMSKLFGVTVGWLLGTEKETPEEGLNEEQLRQVEELVRKYGQEPAPRKNPVWLVLAAVLLAIALLLAGAASAGTGQLQDQVSSQGQVLDSRFRALADQLYQLERSLNAVAESDRLLTKYTLDVQALRDTTDLQAQLTAVPSSWKQGDRAWLSLRIDSREQLRAECSFDGNILSAQFRLPAAESYDPYLIILHSDGSQQQEFLRDTVLWALQEYTQFQLEWNCGGWTGSRYGVGMRDLRINLHPPKLCQEDARWETAVVTVRVNGTVKQSFDLLATDGSQTQFQVTRYAQLVEASADSFQLNVSELGLSVEDQVTVELQGSLTSGHSFQQILWAFQWDGQMLEEIC